MTNKDRERLNIAIGLVAGCLHIKGIDPFSKEGLIKNLEEIEKLLNEIDQEYR